MLCFHFSYLMIQRTVVQILSLFRPPSDGGLMIPPWTKNDALVKRLVSFFFYLDFCQENFMKNLLGKFHADASAWPCSVLLGSAWPCSVPVASLVGGPGGPWPPQNFRIY